MEGCLFGEWQTHLTFASLPRHLSCAHPQSNSPSFLHLIYGRSGWASCSAIQFGLWDKSADSQWPVKHPVSHSPLCLRAFERCWVCSQPPMSFWKAGQVSSTCLLLRSSSMGQSWGLNPERQHSSSTDNFKRWGHLTPTCVNCRCPQERRAAVGMPLLSPALTTAGGGSCSCGLRGKVSRCAFDVNPPASQDEHVPSVELQSVTRGVGPA